MVRCVATFGALVARVGVEWFVVGASAEITAPADGELELWCNDPKKSDNSGSVEVSIVVK